MFTAPARLPHLLRPSQYSSSEQYSRERWTVLRSCWHFVGMRDELAKPGDFLTCDLLGQPIQVRNFDGELHAVSNTCAHRHCLLTSAARGHSPTMQCQYHGWEYDCDGRTRHIPKPKNFVPFDRESDRLPTYRVATCGKLVFVSLDEDGPSLREQLGEVYEICEDRFGDDWRSVMEWDEAYECNWKVAIENSLEAYHVPNVHPGSFGADPDEERSEHGVIANGTWFETDLPFDRHGWLANWFQRREQSVVRMTGRTPTNRYRQVHVFPNLLFSFTDQISLCHGVLPTGPTTARGIARQTCLGGGSGYDPRQWMVGLWSRISARVTRWILSEDLALYADIQRGLEASTARGILGRCEERIHAFQEYLYDALRLHNRGDDTAGVPSYTAVPR